MTTTCAIRSILWIGAGEGLARAGVAGVPTLDITWVNDVDEALALPPVQYDAQVLCGEEADELLTDLRRLRRGSRASPVILCLPKTQGDCVDNLLAAGAAHVLLHYSPEEGLDRTDEELLAALLEVLERICDQRPWCSSDPAGRETPTPLLPGVVGTSRAIRDVVALVERARESTATVLLTGETGTGKEAIARALHDTGARRGHPFVDVNCAAFPDSLLESELFGYVKGAFTGADRAKTGLFQEAHGGTLFLDEVAETSAPLQAKLLRVLQERRVRPVGGSRSRPVDVRVIAASNRCLRTESARGFFRQDLYYRLAVFPITVPPLRDRSQDIVSLARHFLALHGRAEGKRGCQLSHAAAHLLLAHDWPGNVRELENEMHRALALTRPGALITPELLSDGITEILEPVTANVRPGETLRDSMNRIEAWLIRRSLEQNGDRRAATARKLGVTREGLYKKMKRLSIE
jgi:transcriptional regulator with GAF, ATPase, and Fis domain